MAPPRPSRHRPGRWPLHGERMVQYSVSLTRAQWEALQQWGNGNVSAGVRRLLALHPDGPPEASGRARRGPWW